MKIRLAAIALLAFSAAPLQAQRSCTNAFGSLPVNAFGGSGIPTDNSSISQCVITTPASENVVLTMGLRAHQRYDNAAVTTNGAGTFFAMAGADAATGGLANPAYATWNFGFYVGGSNANVYQYKLSYDFNGASGNTNFGSVIWSNAGFADSWNLGMGFLTTGAPGVTPPTGGPFDFNAAGEYTFKLEAYDIQGARTPFASTSMTVVTSTVPEPSTYVLMAAGLAGLVAVQRRRRSA